MKDIRNKINSLRTATASATIRCEAESIQRIHTNDLPKKDVLPFARAAGLLAIKNTFQVVPDCHPLPIEQAEIDYVFLENEIEIRCSASTIYKTGIEVEVMHGSMIAALTIYDMLKPIDKTVVISEIRLMEKSGGKSDYSNRLSFPLKVAVLVISDSVSAGSKQDKAGKCILNELAKHSIQAVDYQICADEIPKIQEIIRQHIQNELHLVISCGGTGLSPRDLTIEAIQGIIDRPIPGIMEAARNYGQNRTPYAMLSRGIAGFAQKTLLISLPGSTRGARESMEALFPYLLHIFKVQEKNYRHQDIKND